jgi:hypothetical protein
VLSIIITYFALGRLLPDLLIFNKLRFGFLKDFYHYLILTFILRFIFMIVNAGYLSARLFNNKAKKSFLNVAPSFSSVIRNFIIYI